MSPYVLFASDPRLFVNIHIRINNSLSLLQSHEGRGLIDQELVIRHLKPRVFKFQPPPCEESLR
jgi:hypothetical protein